MFLFTTSAPTNPGPGRSDPPGPAASGAAASGQVVDAIRRGAEQTGTPFDYLMATAKRESALDPNAKAGTSSATGLFQFIEQTWLGLVRTEGEKLGLGEYSGSIAQRSDGTLTVGDAASRQAILELRKNPEVASVLAGVLTQQNRASLASSTGRDPSTGELYAAHVLGARGAADLIRAASQSPGRAAALDFPDAAAANRGIFYDRGGRARGAAEVYGVLTASASPAAVSAASAADMRRGPVTVTGTSSAGLNGLFQTGGRAGPISDAVAKIWRVNHEVVKTRTAAVSFFPRTDSAAQDAGPTALDPTPPTPASPSLAPSTMVQALDPRSEFGVPLPPPRPKPEELGIQLGRAPLDLSPRPARTRS
jgi:hypothetical protein